MDARAKELIDCGNDLFSKRLSLNSLWQEQAENFYVERADFTASRSLGADFAAGLTTSYPLLCRRDLGNIISHMLRPSDEEWFEVSTAREDKQDDEAKKWLEWATQIQRRAMYDRDAQLSRATKEGDQDFVTFGQCVLSKELNRTADGLLYRCWHLRDVAWAENYKGIIDQVHRKWKPTIREVVALFGASTLDPKLVERLAKTHFAQVEFRHIVIPAGDYEAPIGKRGWGTPFVSIFIDVENQKVVEEIGIHDLRYIIPRWQTVSGSQYAYSPATVCALPDARLIQSMTLVLLEAGEKTVDPPRLTPGDVLHSDANLFAGGITSYDREYDEATGDILRALDMPTNGLSFGMELRADVKEMINNAFYLNKIGLPPIGRDMTAFEVGQRVTEYVRNALPLFEPMEQDYNGGLCELTFDELMRGGAFGAYRDIPQSIRGQDIRFKFKSPLTAAIEQKKVNAFMQSKAMLAEAAALDPQAVNIIDVRKALRDALEGGGTPKAWLRSDSAMKDMDALAQKQQQTKQLLATMGAGADVANKIGVAQQSLAGIPAGARAQVMPQAI